MTFYKENKALKADARESLLGHLTTAVISVFLYTLATSLIVELVANFQSGSVILSLVLSAVIFYVVSICSHMLRIGLASIFLQLLYQKKASIGDLFRAFHENSDTAVTISTFACSGSDRNSSRPDPLRIGRLSVSGLPRIQRR